MLTPSTALDGPPAILAAARALRVLVVDGNAASRLLWSQMLRRLGHLPHAVSEGRAALAAAKAGEFDVVLLDLELPTTDSHEVARQLRNASAHPERPWIIASANGVDTDDYDQAMEAGMNDYVVKSGHFENLTRAMSFAERALGALFAHDQHAA